LIKSIYISRNEEEVPQLSCYAVQKGISVRAVSQIRFEAVENHPKSKTEVIFFSSIRAAEFFLKNEQIVAEAKVATIGISTAKKLSALGIQSDFIGDKAGNPDQVANDFRSWLKDRKVLIPCSDLSNRSIAAVLPEKQVEELIVYRTISACQNVGEQDVYVFTSPSNFHAFNECNTIPSNAKVIAWGKTTENALIKAGIRPAYTLESSTEEELIAVLSTI
jgi:uroporphyrinogen-III synthase